ncbi:cytochrome c [Pleionea sp. CnH1-48]|uniref:c-type cytochrome n=1 Tax=Pleionea sp. CnH1-48 TaxID=2954494 RepID=UPI0020972FF9|nr:cytochrome c [Pleionea sp. CnH1-48]MCO7224134.1 cytochrome c [Pleionea sp. CnH1-48]
MKKAVVLCCSMIISTFAGAADVAAGKAKSVVCASCHGNDGVGVLPNYPNLAGQKEAYLVEQIKAFRDGKRKSPFMSPMTKGLSDADIDNLAAYYAAMPAKK